MAQSIHSQCSQRSGGPGGHFRTAGLSKDHGPHKVRHYYAVLIKGPQGTVVDCNSPDKDGGDL